MRNVQRCYNNLSRISGYSKTPLIKKLGIKVGIRGIIVGAPKDVLQLFDDAPLVRPKRLSGNLDYIHLFILDEKTLKTELAKLKKLLKPTGSLWVSWPKSRQLGTTLHENLVRDIGLTLGLVDIKVVAIDETWSGLKFVYRLKDR